MWSSRSPIGRCLSGIPALALLFIAYRAGAEAGPGPHTTPSSFAAAGAPRDEAVSSHAPAPEAIRDEDASSHAPAPGAISQPAEDRALVLPDDVPTKPRDEWRGPFGKRVTVEGHLGFGTPVGGAGVMLEFSVLPQLSFAAGAGIGSGAESGSSTHAAVAVRARPAVSPSDHFALVLEAAFSTGGYQRLEVGSLMPPVDGPGTPTPVGPSATWAHFLQFGIAMEHRSDKGFMVRAGAGIATMLNPGDLKCVPDSSSSMCAPLHDTETVAVFDFALGQSF